MFREEIAGTFRIIAPGERPDDPWRRSRTGRGLIHGTGTIRGSDPGGLADGSSKMLQRSCAEDRFHAEGMARGLRQREP